MKFNAIQESNHPVQFNLKRNPMDIGANRLFSLLVIVLFPVLLINAIFYTQIELRGLSLFFATGSVAVLLLLVYRKAIQQKDKTDKVLIIDADQIKILEAEKVITSISIKNVIIQGLKWGMEEGKELPAISISGEKFPKITIGSLTNQEVWGKTTASIDTTNYLIDDKEWDHFLESVIVSNLLQEENSRFTLTKLVTT